VVLARAGEAADECSQVSIDTAIIAGKAQARAKAEAEAKVWRERVGFWRIREAVAPDRGRFQGLKTGARIAKYAVRVPARQVFSGRIRVKPEKTIRNIDVEGCSELHLGFDVKSASRGGKQGWLKIPRRWSKLGR